MAFPRNAQVDFAFKLLAKVDGSPITSGTVTGYVTRDGGSQDTLTGTFTHEGNGEFTVPLATNETNGAVIGYVFTHADAIPTFETIFTNGRPEKGVAVTGFPLGMINLSTGAALTSGTVNGYITQDGGTQTALTNSITHKGNGQWVVDLTAAEMNADEIGLTFTHTSGKTEHFQISTVTPVVPSAYEPDTDSPITVSLQQLRKMIALSERFQSHGGSIDTVYVSEQAFTTPKPWAIVVPGERMGWKLYGGGSQNYLRPDGSLTVMLSIDTPTDFYEDEVSAEVWVGDYFGGVMANVAGLSGADSPDGEPLLAITNIELSYMTENHEREWPETGRFYVGVFSVEWGDG